MRNWLLLFVLAFAGCASPMQALELYSTGSGFSMTVEMDDDKNFVRLISRHEYFILTIRTESLMPFFLATYENWFVNHPLAVHIRPQPGDENRYSLRIDLGNLPDSCKFVIRVENCGNIREYPFEFERKEKVEFERGEKFDTEGDLFKVTKLFKPIRLDSTGKKFSITMPLGRIDKTP